MATPPTFREPREVWQVVWRPRARRRRRRSASKHRTCVTPHASLSEVYNSRSARARRSAWAAPRELQSGRRGGSGGGSVSVSGGGGGGDGGDSGSLDRVYNYIGAAEQYNQSAASTHSQDGGSGGGTRRSASQPSPGKLAAHSILASPVGGGVASPAAPSPVFASVAAAAAIAAAAAVAATGAVRLPLSGCFWTDTRGACCTRRWRATALGVSSHSRPCWPSHSAIVWYVRSPVERFSTTNGTIREDSVTQAAIRERHACTAATGRTRRA